MTSTWQRGQQSRFPYSVKAVEQTDAAVDVNLNPEQQALKEKYMNMQAESSKPRNKEFPLSMQGVTAAQFRVKAIRPITNAGANVPAGTTGTLQSGLIRWDDGYYSEDGAILRYEDFNLVRWE